MTDVPGDSKPPTEGPLPGEDLAAPDAPKQGLKTRALAAVKAKAPAVHHFLTRTDKPFPLVREIGGGALILILLGAMLWGITGQDFPSESPVVVIESGSMMHCNQGRGTPARDCDDSFGRLGTIDPGDLVFVFDTDDGVTSTAECQQNGGKERHGKCGDVIVYHPSGGGGTPIIHRALFWMEFNGNGTYNVPECGLYNETNVFQNCLQDTGADVSALQHLVSKAGPALNGYITMGDNNANVDQPGLSVPVKEEWIIGKARGEVPWIGLVKLLFTDITTGTNNYGNAPGDSKGMMWLVVGVIFGGPVAYRYYRTRMDERSE